MAAGSGVRMGGEKPKQFIEIEGVPILRRTLEKFIDAVPGIKVITVLPHDWMESWRSYCLKYGFILPQTLVEGGITRFHSVRNALERVPDNAVVAIHDGVRPLISIGMIKRLFEQMDSLNGSRDGLVPVVPVVDTLKCLEEGPDGNKYVQGEVDRSKIFCAQTPQIFLSERIRKAYTQPYNTTFTDDASVAECGGLSLEFCKGEKLNIKITTPEDLFIANAVIRDELHRT